MKQKKGCVIMASGESVRFGRNKLIEEFQGKTFIQHILDKTEGLFAKRVVVTRSKEVEEICKAQAVEVIYHSCPNRNDTVRIGIGQMKNMDGCLFCPCDQVLLSKNTLKKMSEIMVKEEDIFRLAYEENPGTPILFGKKYFKELAELPKKAGGSYLTKNIRRMYNM